MCIALWKQKTNVTATEQRGLVVFCSTLGGDLGSNSAGLTSIWLEHQTHGHSHMKTRTTTQDDLDDTVTVWCSFHLEVTHISVFFFFFFSPVIWPSSSCYKTKADIFLINLSDNPQQKAMLTPASRDKTSSLHPWQQKWTSKQRSILQKSNVLQNRQFTKN